MKVLLHTDIDGLGYFGDVVEVADGYARNYLLPQKLATQPTEANIRTIQKERARQVELRRLTREKLIRVAEKVRGAEVILTALANEQGHLFGSISEADIAQALQEKGFEVQTKQVVLARHVRELGTYEVKLQFGEDVNAEVQVRVTAPGEQENVSQETDSDDPE